jgi:hypothetical protein
MKGTFRAIEAGENGTNVHKKGKKSNGHVVMQQFSLWKNRYVGAASEPRKIVARCHSHRIGAPRLLHNENRWLLCEET